ncbi:hypothetical protein J6P92_00030 [bacterium]|nr:hypothetical protein [bacterium]
MRVDSNNYSNSPCAFKGLVIDKEVAVQVAKKVKDISAREKISDSINLMRGCQFIDFKFHVTSDGNVGCIITQPEIYTFGNVTSKIVGEMSEIKGKLSVADLFCNCGEFVKNYRPVANKKSL